MSRRPQDKNLVSFADMSPEQAREIQSAGGKASQEKRRQRKAMAELLETYSGLPIRDGRVRNRLTKLGIDPAGGGRHYESRAGRQHLRHPAFP